MANSAMPAAQPSTPPNDLRPLLAAALEAITIPYPATVGDGEVYDRILGERVMDLRVALRDVLEGGRDPGWSADYLRSRLLANPPTGYRTVRAPGDTEAGR